MALNIENFIKELKEMKVVDLNKLIKAIEEEFNVSAALQVAAAGQQGDNAENSEKTVVLKGPGENKLAVIKLIRDVLGLGLMEAKKFVDNGGNIKENIDADEAEKLAAQFKEIGADVEIK
ncbi:/ rplL / 50S ribosomal protein L7/L12 /:537379 Reverse [Candidatus Hepatoplasma crinochetorum]|uniref:Large ribosomal subunit protein bL12 n=1 Tax=Candidatus Hepatoplasma crinochetorum TaxID=295596 RepID=A0A0G7ZN54_9MOLU|nr:/ rplL / 50S ribosomal protein L7/L12 /:537379 Reverse [Candidatus Hepatoplasma crinochetorum]